MNVFYYMSDIACLGQAHQSYIETQLFTKIGWDVTLNEL